MHKVRGNYSSCSGRSSESICSSSAGAQGKGKRGPKQDKTQFTTKNGAFLSFHQVVVVGSSSITSQV